MPLAVMSQARIGGAGAPKFARNSLESESCGRYGAASGGGNPLTGLYGGWQAVENSALALAESADLLLIKGRACSNGEVVNVEDPEWIRFVDDYRAKSLVAYEAALTKNQDANLRRATRHSAAFRARRPHRADREFAQWTTCSPMRNNPGSIYSTY